MQTTIRAGLLMRATATILWESGLSSRDLKQPTRARVFEGDRAFANSGLLVSTLGASATVGGLRHAAEMARSSMKSGSGPRHHHTVPQFYLRRFAKNTSRGPKLSVLDLDRGVWREKQNPARVAHQRDFYAIDLPGLPSDVVETEVLARFESDVAPFLDAIERKAITRSMVEPAIFSPPQRTLELLADFAALMHVRSAPVRAVIRNFANKMGRRLGLR